MIRTPARPFLALALAAALIAGEAAPPADGLCNAALASLGATAKGSGAPFNKDWPANGVLRPEGEKRGGTLFGAPMAGGRIDIRLLMPVDIRAIEVVPLDYGGTMCAKEIELSVDGASVRRAELPESPGKPVRIPCEARGRDVAVTVLSTHPPRDLDGGKKGPNYGGWSRIRVLGPTDLGERLKRVDGYAVEPLPAAIAPTGSSAGGDAVPVEGQPRQAQGHPCTIWDREDIARYKAMLAGSSELRSQLDALKRGMDERMRKPPGVPQPEKAADGTWAHLSDRTYGAVHNALALDIANLGTVWILTGEASYGEFAKKLLLAYADAFPNYGVGARPGFQHDPSKVFDQRLGDATWLVQVARGYDLIHDLPSITVGERKHIEEDLVKASARFIAANTHQLRGATNWSAIATCSILMAGAATDDQGLVDLALWGINAGKTGQQGRWWLGEAQKAPSGIELHFSGRSIDVDGMWNEGAMGYQFMALQALIADAEVLWHRGIDLYRYRDGALKRLFDSPLYFSYPDLTTPAIHDSGHGPIIGREAYLYEFAYRRYRDPLYLSVLRRTTRRLSAQFQQFAVSTLYDLDLSQPVPPVEWGSVNLFGVGYGITRLTDARNTSSLLIDHGPNRSHGHPDKLNLDLWTAGDRLIPDPGIVWYEQPLYRRWYHTTMAHNTLCVDELDQQPAGGEQLVYSAAEGTALMRSRCEGAYPGVLMDRSLFHTAGYVADLFGAFARMPRTMDLCWHVRGDFACDLPFKPFAMPETAENGYVELANPRRTATDGAYAARFVRPGCTAVLHAAGGQPTEIIAGEGHLQNEHPTALLQRRQAAATLYGNVVDISGREGGLVRGVACEGGLDKGWGLLSIATADGDDLAFSSWRGGMHAAGGLETDAQQALVVRRGGAVAALHLGGGTRLACDGASLRRSEPGLALVERSAGPAWVVGNPAASAAEITVQLPGLAGLACHAIDAQGRRTGVVTPKAAGDALTLVLPPLGRVELAPAGFAGIYALRQAMLRQRQAEQEAALAKAKAEATARAEAREAAARAAPVPADTLIAVQAEAFSAQGGGEVRIADNKAAAIGTALSGWNGTGHWLEWTVEAPAAGHYRLAVLSCSDSTAEREIQVDGVVQEPGAPLQLAATGGFANGTDDWQLTVAGDPGSGRPLLLRLKAGTNHIRLVNQGGPANLDWLALCSPDVEPTRAQVAAKLQAK